VNNETVLGVSKPDGTPAEDNKTSDWFNGKVNYQVATNHKVVGFAQWQQKDAVRNVTQFVPWESRTFQALKGITAKGEWQGVYGTSFVTSVTSGIWQWNSPFSCPGTTAPSTLDLATQMRTGCGTQSATGGEDPIERNIPIKAQATWFRPDFFHGNHEFKGGMDFVHSLISRRRPARPVEGDFQLNYRNGVPTQYVTYNFPVDPQTNSAYLGFYLMDSWAMGRRLTLNLGLRYANDRGYVPEQCREAGTYAPAECYERVEFKTWNSFAPRVAASYDLFGTGKTVAKAGWARFDHRRLIDPEVLGANPNVQTATTFTWRDLNGDRMWQPGESNLDPNGPDFVSRTGFENLIPNPNELQPKQDEFMASIEHELMPNLGVRLTGIHSIARRDYRRQNTFRPRELYNIPITNRDPGEDGVLNSADDPGTSVTYYEFPRSVQGAQFNESQLVNFPLNSAFTSMDIAVTRRMADNWMMQASYSGTWKDSQNVAVLPEDNPNADFNQQDNNLEWIAKISGSYRFHWGIMASALYEARSGEPWARTVLFTGGTTIPNLVMNVEPIGTRFYPVAHHLDVRFEKAFTFYRNHEAAVRFNVYNLLNENMTLTANTRSGSTFGRPLTIMAPRLAEVSASYKF
jgi:outer membrane receptor protein involved in Fe transport